jgi:hypothetical protein
LRGVSVGVALHSAVDRPRLIGTRSSRALTMSSTVRGGRSGRHVPSAIARDLADEQRVAAGDIEDGADVGHRLAGRPRHLLTHLGEVEATQIEPFDRGRPQQVGQHPEEDARGFDVAERGDDEQSRGGDLVGEVAKKQHGSR